MTPSFHRRDGILHVERVPLPEIAAAVGTPAYVYSTAALRASARAFRSGLAPIARQHLAFAVKANPNIAVLKVLADEGYGADIVSAGELLHAVAAGMPAGSIIFSGVGKALRELDAGIGQFNLEPRYDPLQCALEVRDTAPAHWTVATICKYMGRRGG